MTDYDIVTTHRVYQSNPYHDDCTLIRAYGAAADTDEHASPMSHGVWSRVIERASSPGPRAPYASERVSPGLQADGYVYGPW